MQSVHCGRYGIEILNKERLVTEEVVSLHCLLGMYVYAASRIFDRLSHNNKVSVAMSSKGMAGAVQIGLVPRERKRRNKMTTEELHKRAIR